MRHRVLVPWGYVEWDGPHDYPDLEVIEYPDMRYRKGSTGLVPDDVKPAIKNWLYEQTFPYVRWIDCSVPTFGRLHLVFYEFEHALAFKMRWC